uniref:Homing endonuclease LAGLIDADG domain-containing protein n=1 Tax=Dactylella tenuis TaxID=383872 RepID=A0A4Y5MV33_9PEZI|nr:hypothetical protein [Dactylella tenuis]QCW06867.1 hypothetical protein [Dactylella tenuis]
MVTMQKIYENKMDNRVSKSKFSEDRRVQWVYKFVKEQRVYGSYINLLRCTLMSFEKNYHKKIPLNQINKCLFSTISNIINNNVTLSKNKLNPWFLTGFSDAESSFSILIQPRYDSKTKWRVKAIFAISLNKKDIEILESICFSFGVGQIYHSGTKFYYRVESFKELNVIIDHFDKYPLITTKSSDFLLFKKCFSIIKNEEHLTEEGLFKLVTLKSTLNRGLPNNVKEKFSNIIPIERPEYKFKGIADSNWVAGFTSGDGSFNIKTTESRVGKVQLRFSINLQSQEKEVIIGLAKFFNLNVYDNQDFNLEETKQKYIYYTKNAIAIQIVKTSDILNIIIPFFEKYSILGQKSLDFSDFKKVANLIQNKEHLTKEGFEKILNIKSSMNLKRK